MTNRKSPEVSSADERRFSDSIKEAENTGDFSGITFEIFSGAPKREDVFKRLNDKMGSNNGKVFL